MRVNFCSSFFGAGFFLVQLSESQVPQPGTGPVPLTVTVRSPNHWIASEFPIFILLDIEQSPCLVFCFTVSVLFEPTSCLVEHPTF